MTDILNQIDEALAHVASCGFCRAALTDRGPSGDWCNEYCQQAWTARWLKTKSGIEKEAVPVEAAPTEPPAVLAPAANTPTELAAGPPFPVIQEAFWREVQRQGFTWYQVDDVTYPADTPVTYAIDPASDGDPTIVIARVGVDGHTRLEVLPPPVDESFEVDCCGHRAELLFGYVGRCTKPAGHEDVWHQDDNGARWSELEPPGPLRIEDKTPWWLRWLPGGHR